jgi:hypothetical protein
MKQNTKVEKLSELEKEHCFRRFYLPGWQFDEIIKPNCILIDTTYICGIGIDDEEESKILIFGLIGKDKNTNEKCIAAFFLKKEGHIYQVNAFWMIKQLLDALEKEARIMSRRKRDLKKQEAKKLNAA